MKLVGQKLLTQRKVEKAHVFVPVTNLKDLLRHDGGDAPGGLSWAERGNYARRRATDGT